MKLSVRLLTASVVLLATLALAFVPVGIGGQNHAGPETAEAAVLGDVITWTGNLFGNNRVIRQVAEVQCTQDNQLRYSMVISIPIVGGGLANGEATAAARCTGDVQVVHAIVTPKTPAVKYAPDAFIDACATIRTRDPRISIPFDGTADTISMFCGSGVLGEPLILFDVDRPPVRID